MFCIRHSCYWMSHMDCFCQTENVFAERALVSISFFLLLFRLKRFFLCICSIIAEAAHTIPSFSGSFMYASRTNMLFSSSIENSRIHCARVCFLHTMSLKYLKISWYIERNSNNQTALPQRCCTWTSERSHHSKNVHYFFLEKTKEVERNLFTVPEPTENGLFLVRCRFCYL